MSEFGKVAQGLTLPSGLRPGAWLWLPYTGDRNATCEIALFDRRGGESPTGWRPAFLDGGNVGIRLPQQVASGVYRVRARRRGGPVAECGNVTVL